MTTAHALRILIVDDETLARARLRDLLDDAQADLASEVVGEAANGREAVEFAAREPVDVVLMDVRMPEMDGVEAARHLATLAAPPAVIFTTAFDAYAVKAFEVNAIDYLLKPVRAERLLEALRRARPATPGASALSAAADRPRRHFCVHERGRVHLVPVVDVLYLRAELKYVTVKTAEREYLIEESLTQLEPELGPSFVRVHRNCLVARAAIAGFERVGGPGDGGWAAVIRATGERLAVSRRQQHVIREFR